MVAAKRAAASIAARGRHRRRRLFAQRRASGATTRSPLASPSHQVIQTVPATPFAASPPAIKVATPMLALTEVLTSAASVNFAMSGACSKTREPLANRFTSHAPTRPSRVFPVAMPSEVSAVPAVSAFTRNAPAKIAGQTRYPSSRNATSAIAVGGHTAVALGFTNARRRPSLPATKYTATSPSQTAIGFRVRAILPTPRRRERAGVTPVTGSAVVTATTRRSGLRRRYTKHQGGVRRHDGDEAPGERAQARMGPEIPYHRGSADPEPPPAGGDRVRRGPAIEKRHRAGAVRQRLHPDLMLGRVLRHQRPLHAQRILIHRDHFLIKENVPGGRGHGAHVVAGDERRREDRPQREMGAILVVRHPAVPHLQHVGIVPGPGPRRLRVLGRDVEVVE